MWASSEAAALLPSSSILAGRLGWGPWEQVLTQLPGPTWICTQSPDSVAHTAHTLSASGSSFRGSICASCFKLKGPV